MKHGREFEFDAQLVRFIGGIRPSDQIESEFRGNGYSFREMWATMGWAKLGHPNYQSMYVYENNDGHKRYFAETE